MYLSALGLDLAAALDGSPSGDTAPEQGFVFVFQPIFCVLEAFKKGRYRYKSSLVLVPVMSVCE